MATGRSGFQTLVVKQCPFMIDLSSHSKGSGKVFNNHLTKELKNLIPGLAMLMELVRYTIAVLF